jgi:hypothetical protein
LGSRCTQDDIYFIAAQVPLDELFARCEQKYPHSRGFRMQALTALVDFEIADQQEEPILLTPVKWNQVKAFCEAEARRLGQQWFAQTNAD